MDEVLRCYKPDNTDPFDQQLADDIWIIQPEKKSKKSVKKNRITFSQGETCWAGKKSSTTPPHPRFMTLLPSAQILSAIFYQQLLNHLFN